MMHSIDIGSKQPLHQLKLCNKCNVSKPPEGGVNMGAKWYCQRCWINKKTGHYLKQNATPKTT